MLRLLVNPAHPRPPLRQAPPSPLGPHGGRPRRVVYIPRMTTLAPGVAAEFRAILGAGVSGLALARFLVEGGLASSDVHLFEAAPSAGGRIAPNASPLTVMRGASAAANDLVIAASADLVTV